MDDDLDHKLISSLPSRARFFHRFSYRLSSPIRVELFVYNRSWFSRLCQRLGMKMGGVTVAHGSHPDSYYLAHKAAYERVVKLLENLDKPKIDLYFPRSHDDDGSLPFYLKYPPG